MAETDWRKVVADLKQLCTEPSEDQLAIASALAVPIDPSMPAPVAAALLRAHLRTSLELPRTWHFGEAEYGYLENLASSTGLRIPRAEEIEGRDLLDAWIRVARARRSITHLERLQPEVDDIAITSEALAGKLHNQITSISVTGRLNFRGGGGRGSWPHLVEQIIKPQSNDFFGLLHQAREETAARVLHPELVSNGDLERLSRWKVDRFPTLADREALEDALATATEERPMQVVLEKHPSILAHTVFGNHGTWVLPQVQFANHYMADFLIARRTSAGLHWTLVELESPTKRLTNPGNGRIAPTLRHAVDQIEDWRRWLSVNLDLARRPRSSNGLGLPGITAEARALIIMGRENAADSAADIRDLHSRRARIEIRTYDWLVRAAAWHAPLGWGLFDVETEETNDW
ncbi:Shedu anti-phage system protein SduA domain-containing protein [Streptosporangium amethystogenes]|uniref:Shedu anti-phage system protein SduA domain-containing protein n=1 Tax=Streptosporangium amethystogenes TaxID=2002 RepID=UPI0004C85024|nr:Shedu anti-phage system protein SduA domain-containing protein [Streptosporangium amethystogenes]